MTSSRLVRPEGELWSSLRRRTQARIGLGRAGSALPTRCRLELQTAQAQARDAVHLPFDVEAVAAALPDMPTVHVRSTAPDHIAYLQRPDLGRRLSAEDRDRLAGLRSPEGWDLVFVIADGLSSRAVHEHAVPVLQETARRLRDLRTAPVVLAERGRVALGDDVGHALGAGFSVVLIGERPGLSAADSLGAYLTYAPHADRTDAERNCVSNIRPPQGLSHEEAARKIATLVLRARERGATGVRLKDDRS